MLFNLVYINRRIFTIKRKLKQASTVLLSTVMVLSSVGVSFGDSVEYEKNDQIVESIQIENLIETQDPNLVEILNDRYYYVTERGSTSTRRTNVSETQARNQDLALNVAMVILSGGGYPGVTAAAALGLGNAINDMNVAGHVITETTIVKRYRVNRLTGARHLDSTTTEMTVRVYAGSSLHRTLSYSLRHK